MLALPVQVAPVVNLACPNMTRTNEKKLKSSILLTILW